LTYVTQKVTIALIFGTCVTIKTFKNKNLKVFFEKGSKKGLLHAHVKKIGLILDRLEAATEVKDMNFPGSDFHQLRGQLKGFYSVHVNGNWTIIFRFSNGEASDVDLIDYH
jgi:proteic killer suppression protein